MDLGFETCGNATLIAYDRGCPVLVTDPWIKGTQYFGSWSLPYRFTAQQLEAFWSVPYVWVSHGHPDHLNLESLEAFRDKCLLVPRHAGGRISADLKAAGYKVQDLPNAQWMPISDRVRIFSCADWNQDTAALIALGDDCAVLNLNDGSTLGTRLLLRSQLQRFSRRFVLKLINYGDADMINYFTESGERRMQQRNPDSKPLGLFYVDLLKAWQATHTAPFSCHHAYARTDSRWATAFETPLDHHGRGFRAAQGEFIPGYFSYDSANDRVTETPVERMPRCFREPAEFGDDWAEPLDAADVEDLRRYFGKFDHIRHKFRFIRFRVGGRDETVDLEGPRDRGITFEAPRTSLMKAVRWEVFDDLLIANFAKTTLHGGVESLREDFTPYVAKYGDNGRAFSAKELHEYFRSYRTEYGYMGWIDTLRADSARRVRQRALSALASAPALYRAARSVGRRIHYGT